MKDLITLREEIDQIDKQIVELYEKRMVISAGVAEYKISTGKKVFDKAAEDFEPEFESAAEDMVDELIDKI